MPLTTEQQEAWDHLVEMCGDKAPLIETTEAMRAAVMSMDAQIKSTQRRLETLNNAINDVAADIHFVPGGFVFDPIDPNRATRMAMTILAARRKNESLR